jgi:hypothetical protein
MEPETGGTHLNSDSPCARQSEFLSLSPRCLVASPWRGQNDAHVSCDKFQDFHLHDLISRKSLSSSTSKTSPFLEANAQINHVLQTSPLPLGLPPHSPTL